MPVELDERARAALIGCHTRKAVDRKVTWQNLGFEPSPEQLCCGQLGFGRMCDHQSDTARTAPQ